MEPNSNLTEQLHIAGLIARGDDQPGDADRLAELVEALDDWLRNGGALPTQWRAS